MVVMGRCMVVTEDSRRWLASWLPGCLLWSLYGCKVAAGRVKVISVIVSPRTCVLLCFFFHTFSFILYC